MINSIRAVRRAKGLTLDEVAARCSPPTTAQTIGRLETGTRTLSLGWMNRIATALGVDASELVQLPTDTQLTITALLSPDGAQAPTRVEAAATARATADLLAVRVTGSIGDYRAGDEIWCRPLGGDWASALNRDVLVPRPAGRFIFARLLNVDGEKAPPAPAWRGRAAAGGGQSGMGGGGGAADPIAVTNLGSLPFPPVLSLSKDRPFSSTIESKKNGASTSSAQTDKGLGVTPLRVLSLATLFPNGARPHFGLFVEQSLCALAAQPEIELTVVAPVGLPPFPLSLHPRYSALRVLPLAEMRQGLTVHRPRFTLIPRVGAARNPAAIAQAVLPLW